MAVSTRRIPSSWWPLALVLFAAAYVLRPAAVSGEAAAPPPPQDLIRIESRLSQLEQRFYAVESNIRGLEQQVRLSSNAPRVAGTDNSTELNLLRSEVDTLRQRLAEVECGLTRVDERTLGAAAKEARRKAAAEPTDPCRLNADAPLRLASRP